MRIDEIIAASPEPTFSFEFFPPKTDEAEAHLHAALDDLTAMTPAFVSVTYGAGGSSRDRTINVVRNLRVEHGLEAMAHLTCVGATKDEIRAVLGQMREAGIDNVLALRGDPPGGEEKFSPTPGGFASSPELTALLAEEFPFCVGGAAYPEPHPDSRHEDDDVQTAKAKVQAGARFLITQIFYDNADYFSFVQRLRDEGIDVPVIPGLMPITAIGQSRGFLAKIGAKIPDAYRRELDAREDDPDALRSLGISYATLQAAELLAAGAPGIHFITMNRSPATRAILSTLRLQRPWDRAATPA
ncbi:methylenetetrahydrofolate reductase [NAD(P)H] [Patulibacter brassicae]|jgi:methylenetetrahydrofolate reductase (NADPH)|uniref:Methylenetetrahydrofolate reductase n=1 Tax=Patulibacter brassicae TaxID=1705717 RepID=A0ABU4VLL4_9ACTN|nr:methylenetetrahydrofolate reductase [NAD(P)H] [Patulibacter brassicae]MDX8151984.1 methylenetetrahydrofolate reductase [NAD(P)H] [Patulibacter brassicae]